MSDWASPSIAFDGIAGYSNRGSSSSIDLSAPGGDFRPGWPVQSLVASVCSRQFRVGRPPDASYPCAANGGFLFQGGTSQASAHVAGVAAIIRHRFRLARRSTALRQRIESCLYRAVDKIGPDNIFGRGRVNAYKAATQPC